MRDPTDLEKAYLAGIIDGEGCIMIDGQFLSTIRVQVSNTNATLIHFLEEVYGGAVQCVNPKATYKCGVRKPLFQWRVTTSKAERVLKDVLPYLKIKRDHALTALKLREVIRKEDFPRSGGIPEEVMYKRRLCWAVLSTLNQKGVHRL